MLHFYYHYDVVEKAELGGASVSKEVEHYTI